MARPLTPAISVSVLAKHYGDLAAVDGLSFDVHPGEVFGILGPNGAGKTTTVEILEGYRRADAGEVRVLGLDPWRDGERLRPRIGVMLQSGGLYPGLSPRELLRLFASYYDDAESPDELLDLVGLRESARTPVRRLSGGQAQRLSLACALIGTPDVFFLDEPTSGMDPVARTATWDIVRARADAGAAVVLTTHGMDEAEHLCDRVAIVARGRLAALGTPVELTRTTDGGEVRFATTVAVDPAALARALALAPDTIIETHPGEYVLATHGTPTLIADLACHLRADDVTMTSLQVGRRTLEEVFLRIAAESASHEGVT